MIAAPACTSSPALAFFTSLSTLAFLLHSSYTSAPTWGFIHQLFCNCSPASDLFDQSFYNNFPATALLQQLSYQSSLTTALLPQLSCNWSPAWYFFHQPSNNNFLTTALLQQLCCNTSPPTPTLFERPSWTGPLSLSKAQVLQGNKNIGLLV